MSEPEFPKAMHNRSFINAPIETVWSTLVATDEPLPFFFGAICQTPERKVGAKLRMVHPNGKPAYGVFCTSLSAAAVYYLWVYGLSGTGAARPVE